MKELIDSYYEFRNKNISTLTCEEDRTHWIYINEISERVLRIVPDNNGLTEIVSYIKTMRIKVYYLVEKKIDLI